MLKPLSFVREKLPYLILGAIVLGLVNGYFNDVKALKGLITPVLFLMIYPMMINMRIEEVFRAAGGTKPVFLSLVLNFILSPVIAYLMASLFFASTPMLAMGLFIISLIPTSGMTASWTGLANGNLRTALVIISTNLLVAIAMMPLLLKLFMGQVVSLNTLTIFRSLLLVVVAPLILGDLTRRAIIRQWGQKTYQNIKPYFANISSVGVLLIVFIAVSLRSRAIFAQSGVVVTSVIPLTLYYLAMFAVSSWLGRKLLQPENATAVVYGSTMRNLTIALGLTLGAFKDIPGSEMAVFLIALAYMIQVPAAAFYMKFLRMRDHTVRSQVDTSLTLPE